MTILPWTKSGSDSSAPYMKTSTGGYFLQEGTVSKRDIPAKGAGNAQVLDCYISGQQNSFNQYWKVLKGEWWGLVTTDNANWTIVRLWQLTITAGYTQIFYGYPKKNERQQGGINAIYAAYTLGETYQASGIGQRLPLFYRYPKDKNRYYEILPTSEMLKFPIGKRTTTTTTTITTTTVGGGRGNNPGWDGKISTTGEGSGTETTVGATTATNPLYAGWPTFYKDVVFPPPASNDNNDNKNDDKSKGQWVTGPDGKPYYLPPGIDFAGLQREYDRTHPKPETKIVVRMPKGYASTPPTYGTKPRMRQRYQKEIVDGAFNKNGVNLIGEEIFVFPYIPQNIRYSDIGSQWQEIPRALNRSFVDWTGYKLMKVSMDFLVTEKMQVGSITTPNVVSDGLFKSVAGQLGILRKMATNKYPVTLEGFDDILSAQMARSAYSQHSRGLEFVIQDLNITAGRRTVDINTGLATNPSNIAAAQVSLTLQEIPIESVTIVKLPPLNLGTPLIGKKEGGGGGGVPSLGLQSDLLTGLKWAVP